MRYKCPCCGYWTIESDFEVVVDICKVCFWQYDWVAHKYPDRVIGPNGLSLNEARENYKKYGICKTKFIGEGLTRKPKPDEIRQDDN